MDKNNHLLKLGSQIRDFRKSTGISQEQLALRAGVDRSYLGGIERGSRNVSFLTLVKIAATLGCSVSDITKEIPENEDR